MLAPGSLQGPPIRGSTAASITGFHHRGCHRAGTAESHASEAGLGLRLGWLQAWLGWLALGLIWLGFGLALAWLGLGFGLIWLLALIY